MDIPGRDPSFVGPKISGFFPRSNLIRGDGDVSTISLLLDQVRSRPDSYGMVQYWDVLLVLSNWVVITPI